MSLFSRISTAARVLFKPARTGQRAFNGAQRGRMYADWMAAATSGDAEIRASFRLLLDRSRDLERNNDYQRGYLGDCEDNIIGSTKFDLRMDCGEYVSAKGRPPVWKPDRAANLTIELAWAEWGKKGTCTVCGRYSWRDVKKLAVRATARDGNFIARKIYGPASGNRFGFALQIWEIDHLDLMKFQVLQDGGEIRFGIERNAQSRVVAYWLMARHPGDFQGSQTYGKSTRFAADEVYHVFVSERPEQSIGLPWCVSAITRLRQLGAFEEAAVIAARIGASKTGFFETTGESEWTGETDGEGRAVMATEPGQFEQLPQGWKASSWNPDYPNIETGDFRKAMLRGVATSLGTSYTTLGNDLESVNFSSARVGLFDERETWKKHQIFFEEGFYEPVHGDWLSASMTSGAVNLPLSKFDKFNRPHFKGRRWPFIDPLKEIQAAKEAIALRLTSRRQVIEEGGGEVEDVFHANLEDEKLAEDIGLSLSLDDSGETTVATTFTEENPDGETTVTNKKKPKPKDSAATLADEQARQTALRERLETYGTAVRAGVITPNIDDEKAMRAELGLPVLNASVKDAWTEDGGARKPITLQGQKENAAQAEVVADAAAGK